MAVPVASLSPGVNIDPDVHDVPVMGPFRTTSSSPTRTFSTPSLDSPPAVSASTRRVGDNELAREQLGFMLDENGSYLQRAARKGEEFANARNLLNSSIAAGASMGAAIDAAAPIAINDANTHSRQELANQDATNNAALESARIHQSNLESIRNNETSRLNQLAQNETNVKLQNLSDASRERSEQLRIAADIDMNSNNAKSQAFNQMLTNIANIESNPELTPEQKNAAIERQIAYQESFMKYQDALQVNSTQKAVQTATNSAAQQSQQQQQASAEDKNMAIYNTAKAGGMSPAQVAASMNLPVSEVNAWLQAKGLSL